MGKSRGPSPICPPQKIPVAGGASLSHAFEDRSDALAGANAHGYQRTLAAGALQFVHGLDGQDVAGGPDRVAQTDARAIGIELGRIELRSCATAQA